jgi:hypothetical protein
MTRALDGSCCCSQRFEASARGLLGPGIYVTRSREKAEGYRVSIFYMFLVCGVSLVCRMCWRERGVSRIISPRYITPTHRSHATSRCRPAIWILAASFRSGFGWEIARPLPATARRQTSSPIGGSPLGGRGRARTAPTIARTQLAVRAAPSTGTNARDSDPHEAKPCVKVDAPPAFAGARWPTRRSKNSASTA